MHIERNVSANILGYLFGEKDTPATRKDMEDVESSRPQQRWREYWLSRREGSDVFVQPRAPYVLTDEEKQQLLHLIATTPVPSGYSATLRKHVGEGRLQALKSHDHHVLLQQILPAAVRHLLDPGPRDAIIRIGHAFQRICAKVINPEDLDDIQQCVAEALCMLEVWFPPGFWDIMSHLPIHLVEELYWCGPVTARWCYLVERYMGTLTGYVRDRSRPEASMASGYAIDEALGFVTEFFQEYPHSERRIWDPEEEARVTGEVLMGERIGKKLTRERRQSIHEYVTTHSIHTAELFR